MFYALLRYFFPSRKNLKFDSSLSTHYLNLTRSFTNIFPEKCHLSLNLSCYFCLICIPHISSCLSVVRWGKFSTRIRSSAMLL